jgi:hypothetical protein
MAKQLCWMPSLKVVERSPLTKQSLIESWTQMTKNANAELLFWQKPPRSSGVAQKSIL